jgi:predicted RNA methylase
VLALGAGTGLLSLLAAGAGAGRVTAIERSRSLYRMAKQALEANAGREGAQAVHLVDRKLQAVGITGGRL